MASMPDSGLAMTEAASRKVAAGCAAAAASAAPPRPPRQRPPEPPVQPPARAAQRPDPVRELFVGLVQYVLHVLHQRLQKWLVALLVIVLVDWLPPPPPPPPPAAPGWKIGSKCRYAGGVAIHVDVIDLVDAQIGGIRHHGQVGAVELVAHVHLLGDATSSCGSVWSMALRVTLPVIPE